MGQCATSIPPFIVSLGHRPIGTNGNKLTNYKLYNKTLKKKHPKISATTRKKNTTSEKMFQQKTYRAKQKADFPQ